MNARALLRAAFGLAFVAACVALLLWVQSALGGRIERNRQAPLAEAALKLVPEAARVEPVRVGDDTVFRAQGAGGDLFGWVLVGRGRGFAGDMTVLVAVNNNADVIRGLKVIDLREMPLVRRQADDPRWRDQFDGLDAARPVTITRASPKVEDNRVQVLSGATVSAESICEIVNSTTARLRGPLSALAAGGPAHD